MRVLVDTAIWSLALRRGNRSPGREAVELRRLILEHRVEMIGPIRQELLSGVREPVEFERLQSYLRVFPDAPILTEDYEAAASFFNLCRSRGIQGSNTDFLICAVAVRNRFEVFTADRDFVRFSEHVPVVLHRIESRADPPV